MASAVLKWWMRIHGGGSATVTPTPPGNLFIPSGSDSLITSDFLTFNHSGA